MPSLALTPRGRLLFARVGVDAAPTPLWEGLDAAFERGSGHGLLELSAGEVGTVLPADFAYWRDFAARLITTICAHPDFQPQAPVSVPALADLEALAAAAPPMDGAEYVNATVLEALWTEIVEAFRVQLSESRRSVQEFLQTKNAAWHLVGR